MKDLPEDYNEKPHALMDEEDRFDDIGRDYFNIKSDEYQET